jgi:hypothetical protein
MDDTSFEDLKKKEAQGYATELEAILNTSLTIENINTYAEDALNSLVKLVGAVTQSHKMATYDVYASTRELEESALRNAGLQNVDTLLDRVIEIGDKTLAIDKMLEQNTVHDVLVPPDPGQRLVNGDVEGYEKPSTSEKTKAILLALSEVAGVNIHDESELVLEVGEVTDEMMRKTAYSLIELPQLERLILVCDEKENITYIFNSTALVSIGLQSKEIARASKSKLDQIISENLHVGSRLIHRDNYLENLMQLIEDPSSIGRKSRPTKTESIRLIGVKNPAEYVSRNGLVQSLGYKNPRSVDDALAELSEKLGEVEIFLFGGFHTVGYSPEQQRMVKEKLIELGRWAPTAPEDVLNAANIAEKIGEYPATIRKLIADISDMLGEVAKYKYSSLAHGYTTEQQQLIFDEHDRREHVKNSLIYVTTFARTINVSTFEIQKTIKNLGIEPIDPPHFMVQGRGKYVLTESQQEELKMFYSKAEEVLEAPEGYLTMFELTKILEVSYATVKVATEELYDLENEIGKFTSKAGRPVARLSLNQQADVIQHLHSKGVFAPPAPEGYLPVTQQVHYFAKVAEALKFPELLEDLGPLDKYRSGSRSVVWYSPEQQTTIRRFIDNGFSL